MNNNTVVLDLKRYHELDNLEKAVNAKETVEICTGHTYNGGYTKRYVYRTFLDYGQMDKALMEVNRDLEDISNIKNVVITQLQSQLKVYEDKEKEIKGEKEVEPETTSDFSKMSIWAFMRWKKNNK